MRKYNLYIKSHCEAPDYEDEVLAESLKDASRKFWKRLGNSTDPETGETYFGKAEWKQEDLLPHILTF